MQFICRAYFRQYFGRGLGPVTDLQFFIDIADVGPGCGLGNAQVIGYFGYGQAVQQEKQNFFLAPG
jgi:hypothetical protein